MTDETTTEQQQEPGKISEQFKTGTSRLRSFWIECKRVLKITKKPSRFEFKTIVSISALGLAIIGIIGFVIHIIRETAF